MGWIYFRGVRYKRRDCSDIVVQRKIEKPAINNDTEKNKRNT